MPLRRAPRLILACLAAWAAAALSVAQPAALSVNPASREEVRQFYRAVYFASENVPPAWSGDYATGLAGDTSAAFKEATRLRINFFRALVGIPADITFNPDYNARAQQAALLQSANAFNGADLLLDHRPPASWAFFSPAAAEASAKSNLAYGSLGPAAITSYVADRGPANAAVGHRRWLFYPQTLQMGTGDVPGDGTTRRAAANATWILDATPGGRFGDPRPATRTDHVAYPPPGFVPYPLVWPRWSFSHPDADFSAATIAMTRNGQPIAAAREGLEAVPIGEPTLVWVYDGRDPHDDPSHPRPSADITYEVSIANVRVGTAIRHFNYRVTVFDPDVAGPDAAPTLVGGPARLAAGEAATFSIAKPTYASGFEWRAVQLSPFTQTYTAESGLAPLVARTSAGYEVVQSATVAAGHAAFHLAHSADRTEQVLALPHTLLVAADSAIVFHSRLGIATSAATARVQVSTDAGNSWVDLFRQSGTSAIGATDPIPTEPAFLPRTLPLAAYAGRTIDLRLVFSIAPGAPGYQPSAERAVGWFVDNLTVTQAQVVTPLAAPTRIEAGTTFSFIPGVAGPFALQARGLVAGAYPLEWGPVHHAAATAAPTSGTSRLANLSLRARAGSGDDALVVGFRLAHSTGPMLIRGIGPTLATLGVPAVLADPRLELFNRDRVRLASNDNWDPATRPSFRPVGAFDLPDNTRDAVLLPSLAPGGYVVHLSAATPASGIALLELYDLSRSRLTHGSARARVGTGDDVLVAGFSIAGTGPRQLLLRAIGPSLAALGVAGALPDPKLELFGPAGKLAENDNWAFADQAAFGQVAAFELPRDSRDAVLVVTLPPGSYTARISGVHQTTGVALVELYDLP